MSPATLRRYRAERMLERDFRSLRGSVLGAVRSRLRASGVSVDDADLDACYAAAWHALYVAALRGERVENPAGWLVRVTHRRAIDELRGRGRALARPEEPRAPAPELEAQLDDRIRVRQLLQGMRERLNPRERQAAALCYLHGFTRAQAARAMGISEARMRKLMDGRGDGSDGVAGKVGALVETINRGGFCDEHSSLMRALAYGLLDPEGERYELAVAHRRGCPACRRYVAALRGLAAALVPPPFPAAGHAGAAGALGQAARRLAARARAGGARAAAGHAQAARAGSALGASPAAGAGGAAGGGWLAGGLAAKLAAGCLIAVGVGAGCAVLAGTHPQPHRPPHPLRGRATLQRAAGESAILPCACTRGLAAAVTPRARGAGTRTPAGVARTPADDARGGRAALEFGPERRGPGAGGLEPVRAEPGPERAARASAAGVPQPRAVASGSREGARTRGLAAEREFSPG